jgi:hypothetical protein
MFVEYMTAILVGIGFASMSWLLLQWRPLSADN